jgi:putative restriction endonuclease
MRGYVAVTDNNWFRYLSKLRPDEVNFWQPGGSRRFRSLQPGEPLLFKLHSPQNFIVGGGFFAHFSLLPTSLAWEAFGEKNGATTIFEMRSRIEQYRRIRGNPHEDYTIGCVILDSPFFLEERDWLPVPEDFSPNIVQGKSYDLTAGTGRELWENLKLKLMVEKPSVVTDVDAPIFGEPVLVQQRLGQGAFRILVTDVYERRCAITGGKALPTLEAAHIRPVSEGGNHHVGNGLLLRSDFHKLFDRGYVTVTPNRILRVSQHLKKDFDNGHEYLQHDRKEIWVPKLDSERPSKELLEWHGDQIFRG